MGKYTRYGQDFPTKWSKWMYPPKNVGLMEYFAASMDGIMRANRGTIRANWTIFPVFAMVWYGIYQVGKAGCMYLINIIVYGSCELG